MPGSGLRCAWPGSAGFDEDDVHKIGMAVRGVINAYNYGNRRDHNKIMMTIELKAEKMVIHVLDQGEGFDLAAVPIRWPKENLPVWPRHFS